MRSAEEIQADAAGDKPFSNQTEYDIWADRYCYECVNDNADTNLFCPILTVALLGSWPKEWTRERVPWTDRDGVEHAYERVDTCTEFEERRDDGGGGEPEPEPVPDCEGQLDIIDVYLPTALDELTPRTVPA